MTDYYCLALLTNDTRFTGRSGQEKAAPRTAAQGCCALPGIPLAFTSLGAPVAVQRAQFYLVRPMRPPVEGCALGGGRKLCSPQTSATYIRAALR